MKSLKLIFFVFWFTVSALVAQNERFTATVDRTNIAIGERIQVSFTVQNGKGTDFKAPRFTGFSVLQGPFTSQSTSIVNGQVSSSFTYTYVIQAEKEGRLTIDQASVTVNGKRLQSNSILITVVKQAQSQQEADDQKVLGKQADEIIKKNFFITLDVNKKSVYQGEYLIATYKLYVTPKLGNNFKIIRDPKYPALNGFWNQDIESIRQLQFNTTEVINGKQYAVAILKKSMLIPQQSGTLAIDPMEMELAVSLPVETKRKNRNQDDFFNDPFDSFFGRQEYQNFNYTIKSKAQTISVKPLPSGAPADFNGGVGRLQMKSWLDKTTTQANEAVSLKIQISGSGNLKLLEPMKLNLPPDIESFDPKIADNVSVSLDGMTGNKIFEYYLIPRHEGDYKIAPISLSYYDLSSGKYMTLRGEQMVLKVTKGSNQSKSNFISGVRKEDVKLLGQDIRHIKSNSGNLQVIGQRFFNSAGFYVLGLLPISFILLFLYMVKRQEKLSGNPMLLKNKRANSIARKRMSTARKLLESKQEEKFFEEINRALWGYTSDKLGIPFSELTKEKAAEALRLRNVPEEKISFLMQTIDYCEFARFAPTSEKLPLDEVYEGAVSAITDMEGFLK